MERSFLNKYFDKLAEIEKLKARIAELEEILARLKR